MFFFRGDKEFFPFIRINYFNSLCRDGNLTYF